MAKSKSQPRHRSIADIRLQIAKLEMRAGDVLIVRKHGVITMAESEAMRDALVNKQMLPVGAKFLIIDSSIELSVLSASEIAARSESAAPTSIESSMLDSSAVARS